MTLRLALLLALAPALACDPAIAQTTSTAAAKVDIVFAPPLDSVLRFRITRSRARGEQPESKASWIEEMRFVRDGEGFVLHWRMDPASLPAEMRDPRIAPMVAPFTGTPIAFEMDADGTLLRVRDWDKLRPEILGLVDKAVALRSEDEENKEQAAQISAQVRAMFDGVDAEGATQMLLKNIAPALNWGGTSMTLGETVTESAERPMPMFGASLLQHIRSTMTALDPGRTARIEMRMDNDRDSLNAFVAGIVQQFGPADDAETKRRIAGEVAKIADFTVVDQTIVELDLATALPRTLNNTRSATVASVKQSDKLLIEWLR